MVQSHQHRDTADARCRNIGECRAIPHGPVSDAAGANFVTGKRLHDGIEAAALRDRTRCAKARCLQYDQIRVYFPEALRIETEPCRSAGPKIVHGDVRTRTEAFEDLLPFLRFEIERNCPFPTID